MRKFLKLIRWNDWYDSKLPLFFFAYYYLLLIHQEIKLKSLVLLIPLGVFFASLASFGYMLNDYSDKTVDKIAGKENVMSDLSNRQQILVLVLALLVGLVVFVPFYQYKYAVVFLFFSYLSSILYSSYPFRLKEKGVWGIICVSLAQRVFPLFIVFAIFEHFKFDALIFASLSFLIGLRWILVHQLLDYDKDMQANVETFTVNKTREKTYDLLLFLFMVEVILATALIGQITYSAPFMLPLLIAYFLYELYLYPFWKKLGFKRMLSSYNFAPLADFYFLWFPLWLSLLLGYINPYFFLITVVEMIWKVRYIRLNIGLIKLRRRYGEEVIYSSYMEKFT